MITRNSEDHWMNQRWWRAWTVTVTLSVLIAGTACARPRDMTAWDLDMTHARLLTEGWHDDTIVVAHRVLATWEEQVGPDHPDVALAAHQVGMLYFERGDYAHAEPLLRRSLAMREKALGPDHLDVASSLSRLATLYMEKADYARAEPLFRRSLAIVEKDLGRDHEEVTIILGHLVTLYMQTADYTRAESLLQRRIAIQKNVLGLKDNHPSVVGSHRHLGTLYLATENYAAAEQLFDRTMLIQIDQPVDFDHLAQVYERRGDHARARRFYQAAELLYERALTAAKKTPHSLREAEIGSALALLSWKEGDYARAEGFYQRARTIHEEAFGPDHARLAFYLGRLAMLDVAQDRVAEAVARAWQAANIQDRHSAYLLANASEERRRRYAATFAQATNEVVSLHVQHAPRRPDAARLALTVLLRRKGRVLDAMTDSIAALRRTFTPGDRALLERLEALYAQIAAQVSRTSGDISPEKYRSTLAALEQERQKLEAEIAERSAAFRVERRLVSLTDVQASIPEGAALVEIAAYSPFEPRTTRSGKARYVAYVLRSSGDPAFTDLGEVAPIDAAVEKLRSALADHDRTHDPKPAARALDQLLMEPIRKLLGDVSWVFLSPDGLLHLVPFGALVDEQDHYLVERYLFSYLTTGRDLLRFVGKQPAPREAALVLANPAFDDSSAPPAPGATHRGVRSIDMVAQRLPPLQSTADEARTIARLFPRTRVLLGADATEEAVKAAHAPGVLHLATHGFFLPEQPVPEVLLGSRPGGEPSPEERAALLQRESPLLRSGIALAGFNRRESGSDDGVLTALEVAGLDLYGTHLVVMSTCESGVGEATTGEGIYGIRRALVVAGSETQVMSLWQVDTGHTREMMQSYYRKLRVGIGRSEAMHEVQLAMLDEPKTAHPNLWASFIVSGNWRALDTRWPEVRQVTPGPRGCSCQQAGGNPNEHGGWLALGIGLAMVGRRRFTDARERLHGRP